MTRTDYVCDVCGITGYTRDCPSKCGVVEATENHAGTCGRCNGTGTVYASGNYSLARRSEASLALQNDNVEPCEQVNSKECLECKIDDYEIILKDDEE